MSSKVIDTLIHEMFMERIAPVVAAIEDIREHGAKLDADGIKADILAHVLANMPKPRMVHMEIQFPDGMRREGRDLHPDTPSMLAKLMQPNHHDRNLYVYGQAGSGKTTSAMKLAELIGVKLHMQGTAMSKYDLLGFRLPSGDVVRTAFVDAWQHGGLIILDDCDRSDPKALSALNAATANGSCDLSHAGLGLIPRHPSCYIVATGNTAMNGQDARYSAASKQDGAFRDRFSFHRMDIDEAFEREITPNQTWTLRVQKIRKACVQLGGNVDKAVMASMRASILGAALLAAKCSQADTEESVIFKGAGEDVVNMVYQHVGKPSKARNGTIENAE